MIFCRFLLILGCWRALGHPSGPHLASKAEKERKQNRKRSPKWRPFCALCHPFGHLGVHLEAPGGKKSVPKASEGDFVDIVKTHMILCFLQVFGASGHPVGVQKLSRSAILSQLGLMGGTLGTFVSHHCSQCRVGVPKVTTWIEKEASREKVGGRCWPSGGGGGFASELCKGFLTSV